MSDFNPDIPPFPPYVPEEATSSAPEPNRTENPAPPSPSISTQAPAPTHAPGSEGTATSFIRPDNRGPQAPLLARRPLSKTAAPISHGKLRHRREIPMLIFATLITIGGIIYWLSLVTKHKEVKGVAALVPVIFVLPFIIALLIRFNYWQVIGNGVEVTPRQFGDLHAQFLDVAAEMGMEKVPRLYLANGNGALNAFASKCTVRKSFIVIYSDLLDIMYEHGDVDGVRFILAHELGHVKMKHVAIWRFVITVIPNYLRLGFSVTRAQEYTADRVAMHYAPEGAPSMMALYAGKRLYRRVDLSEYFASFDNHKVGFWARVSSLMSTHPQGHRRMRALYEMHQKGLDHHGKML
jgi:Zn-dependent protease with chaperone function